MYWQPATEENEVRARSWPCASGMYFGFMSISVPEIWISVRDLLIYTDIRALRFFEPLLRYRILVQFAGSVPRKTSSSKHVSACASGSGVNKTAFQSKSEIDKNFPYHPPPPRARAVMSRWQMTRAVDMWCPTPTGCSFGCHVVLGSMEEAVIPAAHLLQHAPPSRMKP